MPGGPPPRNARQTFIESVAQQLGLSRDVVTAWVQAESGSSQTGAYGGFNFLNLSAKGNRGWSGVPITGTYTSNQGTGSFAKFGSVSDAVDETVWWVKNMGNYAGIKQSAGKPAAVQLGAIARSPWDSGHYGGNGQNLAGAYRSVTNDPIGSFFGSAWHGVSGVAGDVAHPLRTIQHAETAVIGGVMHAVLDVVLLVAGLGLIFMGVRRLSGDRLPSPADIARAFPSAGGAGESAGVGEAAVLA